MYPRLGSIDGKLFTLVVLLISLFQFCKEALLYWFVLFSILIVNSR